MSAVIVLHCDRNYQYGTCSGQWPARASNVEEARQQGRSAGWVRNGDRDLCPGCARQLGIRG